MEKESDLYILSLIKSVNEKEKGVTIMVCKYQERIYWYIRRIIISHDDAQDVMQETFFNAYRYISGFKGESNLYTWLYKIATNEIKKWIKKTRSESNLLNEDVLKSKISEESLPNSDEILQKLQFAIQRLPEKQKLVFNLRYYDELSYSEIAEILEISAESSKANYHYAYEKIKDYMTNN